MQTPTAKRFVTMTDREQAEHLHQMHSFRMPVNVTADTHQRDHERTDRNVSMDIEPHTHVADPMAELALALRANRELHVRHNQGCYIVVFKVTSLVPSTFVYLRDGRFLWGTTVELARPVAGTSADMTDIPHAAQMVADYVLA